MNLVLQNTDQRDTVLLTRARVREVTGLTADEISALQFELAFDWLELVGCTGEMQTQMASTPEFWANFWRPEWHRLDVLFLRHYHQWQYTTGHQDWYAYFHGSMKYLNSPIVHASYHQVIKAIVKNKV